MSNRIIKFRFWTPDKQMIEDHEGWTEGIGINYALRCSAEYGYKIMQFTGFQIKGVDLWEDDIVREETPTDGFDEVRYLVCTWISEWGMWGLLHADGEWQSYKAKGVTALDQSMFWTFPIDEADEKYRTICGNIHQHPEKINQ